MKFFIILMLLVLTINLSTATTDISKVNKKNVTKQRINSDMTIKYKKRPKNVDEFTKVLTNGLFYGRLRSNTFIKGTPDNINHYISGLGGSLIYKSARYKGFSFTTGLYTSQTLNHIGKEDLGNYRSGKDTFSRYNVATKNRDGITVFAQNYLSFRKYRTELRVGRFLLETAMLKSHDTKMIPNAFEGASLRIGTFPNTKIQWAYITKQKLRDHERFHRVLAYNDDPSNPYAKWTGNDDGAMHQGLTTSKLDAKGIDDHIIVVEGSNRSIDNTTLQASYTAVPDLISTLMFEGSHKFKLRNGLKIKPAIRYIHQFDNGAGEIGGANLKNDTRGYTQSNSLANDIFSSKIDFIYAAGSLRIGYTNVAEGGDIISPWHAQPTAGYSRAMTRLNWFSNTKTTMLQADYDLSNAGLLEGIHLMSRYAIENFDDHKPGTTADANTFTFDIVKRFKDNPNLFFKIRTAFVNEDHRVKNIDGSFKKDPTYNSVRVEMNYLF